MPQPNPPSLHPGAMATNPQNQETFADLLSRGKRQLATQLIDTPTPLDRLADFGNLYAMSQARGAEGFNLAKQQQVENQRAQQEQLRGLLAHEDERSLQIAKHALEQQIAEGDAVAVELNASFPDTDQGNVMRANAARLYGLELLKEIKNNPGINDDDQIPLQRKREILRSVFSAFPDATAEPGWVKTSRPATEAEKSAYGVRPGQPVEMVVETNPATGEERVVGVENLGPSAQVNVEAPKYPGAFDTAAGKADVETLNNYIRQGEVARQQGVELDRMQAAMQSGRFTTGLLADPRVFIARVASYMQPALLEDQQFLEWIGDDATADTLDAATSRLVNLGLEEAGGRTTNLRIQFLKNALPALFRSAPANTILIKVMQKIAEHDQAVANIAEKYYSGAVSPSGQRGPFPSDARSFRDAKAEYEKANPIITPELEKEIREGTKGAKRSWKDIYNPAFVPEGVPSGSVLYSYQDGYPVYKTPDGRYLVVE